MAFPEFRGSACRQPPPALRDTSACPLSSDPTSPAGCWKAAAGRGTPLSGMLLTDGCGCQSSLEEADSYVCITKLKNRKESK